MIKGKPLNLGFPSSNIRKLHNMMFPFTLCTQAIYRIACCGKVFCLWTKQITAQRKSLRMPPFNRARTRGLIRLGKLNKS